MNCRFSENDIWVILLEFGALILPERAAQRQRFGVAFEEIHVNFGLRFPF
jgi:hypothetical protein